MANKEYYIGMHRAKNQIVYSDNLDYLEKEYSVDISKDCVGPFSEDEFPDTLKDMERAIEIYFENDSSTSRNLPIDLCVFYNLMVVVSGR